MVRLEAGTGERRGSQRPKQSLESGVPGKRKEFQNPELLSLEEKEAVNLEGKLGYRPGLEDPVVMQGLSPKMETLGPLGLAVDRNELSEYSPLMLSPIWATSPKIYHYCLCARPWSRGFIYTNSISQPLIKIKNNVLMPQNKWSVFYQDVTVMKRPKKAEEL